MITMKAARRTAAALLVGSSIAAGVAWAATDSHVQIDRQNWTFSGMLGHFDQAQLQRGFKVYVEACARCHSMKRIAFRNLTEATGPNLPEAAVKSLAATYQVEGDPNEQGKIEKRPAVLTDYLPAPFKNDQEARAALNGALPPDLSLIAKARSVETNSPFYMVPINMVRDLVRAYQEPGPDYIYAFLMGYTDPPKDTKVADGMNYNRAFPGHMTAMPNPFAAGDGFVKYDDDTPATVDNYARDVTAFLAWAGDPRLEERKRMGLLVMLYLLITAILLYLAKRRIWAKAH